MAAASAPRASPSPSASEGGGGQRGGAERRWPPAVRSRGREAPLPLYRWGHQFTHGRGLHGVHGEPAASCASPGRGPCLHPRLVNAEDVEDVQREIKVRARAVSHGVASPPPPHAAAERVGAAPGRMPEKQSVANREHGCCQKRVPRPAKQPARSPAARQHRQGAGPHAPNSPPHPDSPPAVCTRS